jgi:hypothetical protein
MSVQGICVAAKHLLPGAIIALPAPTSGAAVETQAEVIETFRTVRRRVDESGKLTEEDSTTLNLILLPLRGRSIREVPSSNTFFLVGRAHQ